MRLRQICLVLRLFFMPLTVCLKRTRLPQRKHMQKPTNNTANLILSGRSNSNLDHWCTLFRHPYASLSPPHPFVILAVSTSGLNYIAYLGEADLLQRARADCTDATHIVESANVAPGVSLPWQAAGSSVRCLLKTLLSQSVWLSWPRMFPPIFYSAISGS